MPARTLPAVVTRYEFQVDLKASPHEVWKSLIEEIDAWWLPDFNVTGEGARLRLEPRAGGHLLEEHENGSSLLWYTVQCIQPGAMTLYLQGDLAPDWGGPATSSLKLRVEETSKGARLHVSDALHGHLDEGVAASLESGWKQLFAGGLKEHVERGAGP